MIRIIDKRSSGKTSRLLLLAKEKEGIVVCNSPSAMREKAYGYGLVGIDFMSYGQYLQENKELKDTPIFIDELEDFLKYFSKNIQGYTVTEE